MYLLEDKSRLASVTDRVVEIIKSVQIGNRNFQNICVHAKVQSRVRLPPQLTCTLAYFSGESIEHSLETGAGFPRDKRAMDASDPDETRRFQLSGRVRDRSA